MDHKRTQDDLDEKRTTKNGKMSRSDFFNALVSKMNGRKTLPWADFPQSFKIIEDDRGVETTVMVSKEKVCSVVDPRAIKKAIWQYYADLVPVAKSIPAITYQDTHEIYNRWSSLSEPIEDIKPVAEKSDDCYTWHRLPFDLSDGKGMATPMLNEFLGRIQPSDNAIALMAWVGSLFDPYTNRDQYVWLYGEGRNGKSSFLSLLKKIMGGAYANETPPQRGDNHWAETLIGKRVIAFPDCNSYGFPTTGQFKAMTGDNTITINPKGRARFEMKIDTKFIFMSNKFPSLSGGTADRRRAIYCEIDSFSSDAIPTTTYDKMLWGEAPGFLYQCVTHYKSLCPGGGTIPTNNVLLDEIIEENEEDFHNFIATHIESTKNAEDKIPVEEMNRRIRNYLVTKPMRVNDLKQFLGRNIRKQRFRTDDGKFPWYYIGVRWADGGKDRF